LPVDVAGGSCYYCEAEIRAHAVGMGAIKKRSI
jgi:hypothetical protein